MFPDTLVPRESPVHRACLALVAALLLFAGSAELVDLTGPSDRIDATSRQVGRLAADQHLPAHARDGRVLVRLDDTGPLAIRRDASDASLLHVVVPHGTKVVDCNLIAAQVAVMRQDAHQVRLRVSGYEYEPAAVARTGGNTCVQAGTADVPVRLKAPLAGRSVYLGQAPKAVPVGPQGASVP